MELQSATVRHNCVRQAGHRQIEQRPKRYGSGIRIRVFIILLLSLILFAASTSLLKEGWLDKAAIFFNKAIFSCSESKSKEMFDNLEEDHKRVCVLRYESVHENLKILLAATMVLSLIGTVLNAVMMVTVSRDQYEKSLHDSWVLMVYFSMFLCFVTVILMPFALFLWTTVRSMRQYRDLLQASRVGNAQA